MGLRPAAQARTASPTYAALLFAVLVGMSIPGPALAKRTLEYAVKATYLYKLAPFVQWPDSAFVSSTSPIVICIVGEDPFGRLLDEAVADQSVSGRPIAVRRYEIIDSDSGCHIIYAAGSKALSVAEILRIVRDEPVLTVTDETSDDPSGATGMVHFVISSNRVRFHIDDIAAAQSGIVISSKLLNLALSVKSRLGVRSDDG